MFSKFSREDKAEFNRKFNFLCIIYFLIRAYMKMFSIFYADQIIFVTNYALRKRFGRIDKVFVDSTEPNFWYVQPKKKLFDSTITINIGLGLSDAL